MDGTRSAVSIAASDSAAFDPSSSMNCNAEDTSDGSGGLITPASSAEHAAEGSVHDPTAASTLETTEESITSLNYSAQVEPRANVTQSSSLAADLEAGTLDPTEKHPGPLPSSTSTDNSLGATEHFRVKAQPSRTSPRPFPLPDWLLEHCVTLRETWKDTPDFLVLLGEEAFDERTRLLNETETRNINAQDLANMPYAMDELWFDQLLMLVRPGERRSTKDPRHFTKDVVLLQSPVSTRLPSYRTRFLTNVVKQFAKTIGSDLVLLGIEDIKDFTERCWATNDEEEAGFCTADLFEQFEKAGRCSSSGHTTTKRKSPRHPRKTGVTAPVRWTEPFKAVLDAPKAKRHSQSIPLDDAGDISLVIFLSVDQSEITSDFVTSLRRVSAASFISHRTMILVARSCFGPGPWYRGGPVDQSNDIEAFHVLPARTPQMKKLLEADDTTEQRNRYLRYLQRRIRHRRPGANKTPLTTPHVQWDFLEKVLEDNGLGRTMTSEMLQLLDETVTDDQIKTAVHRFARRKKALEVWETSSDEGGDQWSTFPEHVQKHLREIDEGKSSEYEFERQLLPLLVAPAIAEEALAQIAVDEEMVKAVKRAVEHHQNPDIVGSSYGILQREQAGGVLLYGPPGTGKTLLARVLAATTNSIVISATAADIQSQYCGESPKVVKALFALARRIAPSIIFIDEADALFGARTTHTSSTSDTFYRETTTQLLTEMDGFSKSKDNPLVILATNLPTILDPAVLRRVPNVTYMGLPTVKLREQIFRIMLKGEVLDPAIDMARLAQMTPGYSGSDIKSLCVKAALLCEKFVESGEFQGRRLLTWSIFDQVLAGAGAKRTTANSVSRPLREFAKKHDPAGYQRMQRDEAEIDSKQLQARHATDASGRTLAPEEGPSLDPLPIPLSSTTSFATSHDGPKLQYTPLPMNSKKIRLLTLHPTTDKDAQVSGDLTTVDLEDYTQSYKDFHARLPGGAGQSDVDRGLTRHFMWNLVNIDPGELDEPRFSKTAREVAHHSLLYRFCDRPLEQMKGLVDRYSWGDFLALSYAWGDPTKRSEIILNGVPFGVGDNLHAALLRLRSSYEVRERCLKVWIDAICINQDDLVERSVEVQKMRLIYTEALAVRGWLGHSPLPHITTMLSSAREIWQFAAESLRPEVSASPLQTLDELHDCSRVRTLIASFDKSVRADYDTCMFRKDEFVFKQTYWDRLWILQEMALASSLVFWFNQGDFYITPQECSTSLDRSRLDNDPGGNSELTVKGIRALTKLLLCRFLGREETRQSLRHDAASSRNQRGQVDLHQIIRMACLSNATDPRDKVYGLLAILPERISRHIEPRYDDPSLTWKRVWVSFSRICLEQEGNLDLLAKIAQQRGDYGATSEGFPSWAFDLTTPEWMNMPDKQDLPEIPFEDIDDCYSYDLHDEAFAADSGMPAEFSFSDDGLYLACKVVFVDIVSAVTAYPGDPHGFEEDQTLSDPPPRMDLESARLSLGRVLSLNSKWVFPDHPTIFDVPWPDNLACTENGNLIFEDYLDEDSQRFEDEAFAKGEPVSWAACFRNSPHLRGSLGTMIWGNADFKLHGIPLRDYFTSDQDMCPPPGLLNEPAFRIRTHRLHGRLFRTRKGRIGTLVRGGRPGDRIAVVGGCDCPLVLRPRGDGYMIVDNCVVDGLMDGQAAEMVERGELAVEDIVIC